MVPIDTLFGMDASGVFEFSASSIKTWDACQTKWGYTYINGIRPPAGKAAALGSAIHKELEGWLTVGRPPTIPAAKRSMPMLPTHLHPGLRVEHPFRILFPVGIARGFVDLLIPQPDPKRLPDDWKWSPSIPAVIDHKSTSSLDYALDEDGLRQDPQAILYGIEARLATGRNIQTVPEVDLSWNYTSTKSKATRPVRLRQTLQILEEGLAPLLMKARQMSDAEKNGIVSDLASDLRTCEKYGGCPFRAICPSYANYFGTFVPKAGSGSDSNVPDPVASDTKPKGAAASAIRKEPALTSSTLARLRANAKKAATIPAPTDEPAPPAPVVGGSPSEEPSLPKASTAGLDIPLPKGSSPIVPPDAAPNVSQEDPPVPKTKGKSKPSTLSASEIETFLRQLAAQALSENRLLLANSVIASLACVQQGG